MDQGSHEKKQKKAMSSGKKIWLTILIAVAVFIGAVAATIGVYVWLHPEITFFEKKQEVQVSDEGEELPVIKEQFSLLVMGVDEREDDIGRSDTMFYFSIPYDGGKPLLISIPRDTMIWKKEVQIYERINAIYPVDGIEATVQMVQNLLGVPINGYVKINLEGFVELVDIMGGVQIYLDQPIYKFNAGNQILNGVNALEFVRYRSDGKGDIGRIARQQDFLKAVMKQALSVNNISRIPGMLRQGLSMVETNISVTKMFDLANTIVRNGNTDFDTAMLPGDGLYYGRAAMWMLRLDEMYHMLAELLVPEDQDVEYLKLLEQNWVSDYKRTHDQALATALFIWQETGMTLSEEEYENWKIAQNAVAEEPVAPQITEPVEGAPPGSTTPSVPITP